jgi:2-dehydro-3-deoxyphosphogluconate aldolase/(4S)-4-hydroxy-2-oxoglutarate aldolase
MTPNEIIYAHDCGADIVHVYPARWLGPAYFTCASKALNHIPTMTSGGIDRNNLRLYMNAGVDVVVADVCLYSNEQLAKRQWCTIAENMQSFMNTVVKR